MFFNRSPSGRARAWLRLALMQKKLADYFRHLVDQGDEVLSDFYEPRALLRSEEAAIVTGLLLGLNIVDCNLCVKVGRVHAQKNATLNLIFTQPFQEEDLESQQGVIDFSLYLRNNKAESGTTATTTDEMVAAPDFTAVLDQKNYIEELNRHLK